MSQSPGWYLNRANGHVPVFLTYIVPLKICMPWRSITLIIYKVEQITRQSKRKFIPQSTKTSQTYFLFVITSKSSFSCLFPLGSNHSEDLITIKPIVLYFHLRSSLHSSPEETPSKMALPSSHHTTQAAAKEQGFPVCFTLIVKAIPLFGLVREQVFHILIFLFVLLFNLFFCPYSHGM